MILRMPYIMSLKTTASREANCTITVHAVLLHCVRQYISYNSFHTVLCTAFSNQLIMSGLNSCSTLAELSCQSPEEFGSAGCVWPSGPSRDGSLPKQSNLWRQQSGGVPIKSISGRSNSRMWHQDVTSWAELAAGPALVYCSSFTQAHNWKNSVFFFIHTMSRRKRFSMHKEAKKTPGKQ